MAYPASLATAVFPRHVNLTYRFSINANDNSPLRFDVEMEDEVRCVIDDGSNRSCNEYIANLPAPQTQQDCTVDLRFFYDFTNIGTICDDIYLFKTGIDGKDLSEFAPAFADDEEKYFCPGEQIIIEEPKPGYDVCSLSGRDVPFDVELNLLPFTGESVFTDLPTG